MGRKKQADRKGGRSTDLSPPPGPTQGPAALQPGTSEAPPPPPKEKKPSGFSMLLLHVHPRMVPEEALAFMRTCGLGGMAVVLLVLLAGTGALLLLAYEPSAERAYGSVLGLRDDTAIGGFVRNIHFWAANSLVLVAVPASPAGLLHRGLSRAATIQLGHRAAPAQTGPGVQLHGLPAPLGPARFLGRDHRHGDAGVRPAGRPHAGNGAAGRARGRAQDPVHLLRPAHRDPADPGGHPRRLSLLARPEGGWRHPPEAPGAGTRASAHDGPHLAESGVPRNGGGPRSGGGCAPHRRGLRCAAPGAGESGHEPEPGQGPVVFHGDPGASGPSAPGFRRPGGADAGGGLPGVSTLPELRRDPLGPLVPLGQWAAHGPGGRGDGPGGSARRHPHYRVCAEPPEAACRSCPRP